MTLIAPDTAAKPVCTGKFTFNTTHISRAMNSQREQIKTKRIKRISSSYAKSAYKEMKA